MVGSGLSAGNVRCGALAFPLLGKQPPEPDPASALRLLLPSVWSLGRPYPLTRLPVMSIVVYCHCVEQAEDFNRLFNSMQALG